MSNVDRFTIRCTRSNESYQNSKVEARTTRTRFFNFEGIGVVKIFTLTYVFHPAKLLQLILIIVQRSYQMCGIFLSFRRANNTIKPEVYEEIQSAINRRGDEGCIGKHCCSIQSRGEKLFLEFYASVLNLRSNEKSTQPLVDENGNVLLFNGEIFEFVDSGDRIQIEGCTSDTQFLFEKLTKVSSSDEVLSVFSRLRGPFSFIYYSQTFQRIWFGKDFVGRRSLILMRSPDAEELVISSTAPSSISSSMYNITEVTADGIKWIDIQSPDFEINTSIWCSSLSGSIVNNYGHRTLLAPLGLHEYLSELNFERVVEEFINILNESVKKRVTLHNFKCRDCTSSWIENCDHPSIAILFSGGIDSTIISLLAHSHIPSSIPIDLLNVSFDSNAPDRLTGKGTVEELRSLFPDRIWNFVAIDVDKQELDSYSNYIRNRLVYPSEGTEKVIDESVACSLWFAARASGHIISCNGSQVKYESPARILLSGLGADEQLAGYSRHRRIFYTGGVEGLKKELAMDLDRISSRNLGRDDRVIGDHGKETRHPFLDEDVISFLNQVRIDFKCNLKLDRGVGEKYLLREACRKLGLSQERCSTYKRAIQFGSRIAQITRSNKRMDSVKEWEKD